MTDERENEQTPPPTPEPSPSPQEESPFESPSFDILKRDRGTDDDSERRGG